MCEEKLQPHQPKSILYSFKFIMKSLSSAILKLLNLGRRTPCSMPPAPPISGSMPGSKNNQMANAEAQGTSGECEIQSDPSSSLGSLTDNGEKDDRKLTPVQALAVDAESSSSPQTNKENGERHTDAVQREAAEPEASIVPHAKAPEKLVSLRKTVSINYKVEVIDKIMKKRKSSKSLESWNSLEYEEDEPKPLRSILKVSSDLK